MELSSATPDSFTASNGGIVSSGGVASLFNNSDSFTLSLGSSSISSPSKRSLYQQWNGHCSNRQPQPQSGDNGSTTGSYNTIAANGTVNFAGGLLLSSLSSINGNGTVKFSSGNTTLAGAYNVTGNSTFGGGNVTFNNAITSLGIANFSSGNVNFGANNLILGATSISGGTISGTGLADRQPDLLTWSGGNRQRRQL